jgi:hypothetical protein
LCVVAFSHEHQTPAFTPTITTLVFARLFVENEQYEPI